LLARRLKKISTNIIRRQRAEGSDRAGMDILETHQEKPENQEQTCSAPNLKSRQFASVFTVEMLKDARNPAAKPLRQGIRRLRQLVAWIESNLIQDRWNKAGEIPRKEVSVSIRAHYDAMEAQAEHLFKMAN